MRRVCLTLPTDRACGPAIEAMIEEASYAADRFGVEVCLLVLDSCPPPLAAEHAALVSTVEGGIHLDEAAQRRLLRPLIDRAGRPEPDRLLDLLLPAAVSYGACTNRAFLLARAYGCDSVHRRDSDSRYQVADGGRVFPIEAELRSLGKPAAEAVGGVSETLPGSGPGPVVLVGGSFVGAPSVDVDELLDRDPQLHDDIVGLAVPDDWPPAQRRRLARRSFRGAGAIAFTGDQSTLGPVDPTRVDMCNVSFFQVQEDVPLPPATDTIGSDYFLVQLVHDLALAGVVHNRHIVNYHTDERKAGPGFVAYHRRLVKFLLAVPGWAAVHRQLSARRAEVLDHRGRVRADRIAEVVRTGSSRHSAESRDRLDRLEDAYRRLGARFAPVADALAAERAALVGAVRRDAEEFATLIDAWPRLMDAARW